MRRVKTVRHTKAFGTRPRPSVPPLEGNTDGFSLQLAGRRGVLSYRREQPLGFEESPFAVETAKLEIPDLSFPVDLSQGVRRFRNRRLRLMALSFTVDSLVASRQLYELAPFLRHLELKFETGYLAVLAEVESGHGYVPVTFRVHADPSDAGGLEAGTFWAYGNDPQANLRAIERVRDFVEVSYSDAGAGPQALLKSALIEVFPMRGWRLPDYSNLRIVQIGDGDDKGRVLLAARGYERDLESLGIRMTQSVSEQDGLSMLLESRRGLSDLDAEVESLSLLFKNGNELEKKTTATRLAELLASAPASELLALVEEVVDYLPATPEIWENIVRALAASGDRRRLHQYIPRWLAASASANERFQNQVRAGDLLLNEAKMPEEAVVYFERASRTDPGDFDAAFGLALSHLALRELSRATALLDRLERRVAETKDTLKLARVIAAHGELALKKDDHLGAREHFNRALDLYPDLTWARKRLKNLEYLDLAGTNGHENDS